MLHASKVKILRVALVCAAGVLFALPNMLSQETLNKLPGFMQNTVNLGLELRGGSHLQLEVDLKSAAKDHLNAIMDEVRASLRKEQIGYTNLNLDFKNTPNQISFTLRNPEDKEKALGILRKVDQGLDVSVNDEAGVVLQVSEEATIKKNAQIIEQSIEVVRRRIDETGTKEPNIQRQGDDRIVVQLPGVEDPAEVKKMIGKTAKLTFRMVDHDAAYNQDGSIIPSAGSELLVEQGHNGQKTQVPVKREIKLTGDQLVDAQATTGDKGPAVSIKFNNIGSRKFGEISSNNVRKRFAIILDNTVISAPVFNEPIMNGQAVISGSFTLKEAHELALLLRAGSLPAPLKVIEESTVGPSLGADSIKDGQNATILAFILVSIFMMICYSVFGFIANIALAFNLILLFAGLSLLGATLTLPGIAGIALTIGMAVDANVLIYERIKEELRLGSKPLMAIDAGYKRAMTTIIDSNLTTLLGAAVLYEFGSGPIRGFAVTLALGILISLFTALSLTKIIITAWFGRKRLDHLPI